MAALGPTVFAAFVWANVLLVLAVFVYEIAVVLREQGLVWS